MPDQVVVGRGGCVSLGAQAAHATADSSTINLPIISAVVTREDTWTRRPNLSHGTAGGIRYRVKTSIRRPVKLVQEFCFSGQGLLLRAALGDAATTGAGPYVHTYTLIAALPILTVIVHDGVPTATVSAYKSTVDSCYVNQLRISLKEVDICRIEADIIGRSEVRATTTAPSPTIPNPVMGHQGSTLAWNSTTIKMHSADITLDNSLEDRRGIGSLYISRLHAGMRSVRLTATLDVVDDAAVTALVAGTQGDAVLTITGTGNEAMTITLHNAQIVEEGTPIDTYGALKRTVTWEASADGTDQGLTIAITNDISTAIL